MTSEVGPSLRERKRLRTRAALVEAGRRLFEKRGYDETTVADVAAAAEIGTRTFFAYFDSKEQLLFPEADARVAAVANAIESRGANEPPVGVLLRALDAVSDVADMADDLARLRLRLIRDVPAVQSRALRLQAQAQRDIARMLTDDYPALDPVAVAALVGAFVGAVAAAIDAMPTDSDAATRASRLRAAVISALGSP